ncbi:phosphoribosylamine--glycine ligase, partial [Oleiphilus sp. HI0067]
QDHKRVGNGDTGPNTGGMGAYSPAPVVTPEVHARIMDQVINPTLKGMAEEGNRYRGFLYAGLMISPDGQPKVIEFNCRFGDPETQPIMMRLASELAPLCSAAINGTLADQTPRWHDKPAVGLVLAAGGYPAAYDKGIAISGLTLSSSKEEKVFHAGTSLKDGEVVTSGGRVLCATALGDSVSEAASNAYALAKTISWEGMFYR